MQFLTVFVALAAAVVPAFASPAPVPEPAPDAVAPEGLQKRDTGIYVCEETNWGQPCVPYQPVYNQCTPWSALGLSGLGSWGPDEGVYCIWYNVPCGTSGGTGSDSFTYPGWSTVPGYWQYNTQSWKCWW